MPRFRSFLAAYSGRIRPDARPHDAAKRCEFIVADYYLPECLLVLAGS